MSQLTKEPVGKVVETELAKIKAKHGQLTPELVVEEAQRPKSPLHQYFEWDDSAAAVKYRLEQARTLIRSVRVDISVTTTSLPVPRYVRDPRVPHGSSGYADVDELSGTDYSRVALDNEFQAIEGRLVRAYALAAHWELTEDLKRLEQDVQALRRKLKNK